MTMTGCVTWMLLHPDEEVGPG